MAQILWIARDFNGSLCLYTGKPHRKDNHWDYTFRAVDYCELDKNLYPEITWENSPQKVELKLKQRVNNELQGLINEIEELKFQLSFPDSFCKELKDQIVCESLIHDLTRVIEELKK